MFCGNKFLLILGSLLILLDTVLSETVSNNIQRYSQEIIQLSQNKTFLEDFRKYVTSYNSFNMIPEVKKTTLLTPGRSYSIPPPIYGSVDSCGSVNRSWKAGSIISWASAVHRLRPGDIDVVAAMGDSFTAGFGAKARTVLGLLIESRGISWSIGGDESINTVQTLPNMLKVYNPYIKGYSVNFGGESSKNAHLNVAVTGATSQSYFCTTMADLYRHAIIRARDMPEQAKELIKRMKSSPEVNFENDWKMITIMIGGNDLCDYCSDKETYSAENYKSNMQESLDILFEGVPKAFVNLVSVFHVVNVREVENGLVCSALHLYACACVTFNLPGQVKKVNELNERFQLISRELITSGRYDGREDFTVVVQPFFEDLLVPMENNEPDFSYFAPDCFHLSERGHAAVAGALWNNLVEKVGSKRKTWDPEQNIECPTEERPYFYTKKNSLYANSMILDDDGSQNKTDASQATVAYIIIGSLGGSALVICVLVTIRVIQQERASKDEPSVVPVLSVNAYTENMEAPFPDHITNNMFLPYQLTP